MQDGCVPKAGPASGAGGWMWGGTPGRRELPVTEKGDSDGVEVSNKQLYVQA